MKPLPMAELERKAIRLELKMLDETGTFEGYASTFGNEDQGQDIVVKGAFLDSLKERGPVGVKMLYEHNPTEPIGKWVDLREDDRGLYAKGQLLITDLQKAREVHAMMKNQILDGLSIGFRCIDSSMQRGEYPVRLLQKIDLREISAVLFPMNEEAAISSVKAANDLPTEREFQCWLQRDAGFSRSEAEHVIRHGLKSLIKAQRDAGGEKVASKQPDVAWSSPFIDELRRLTEAASS
jgi:HK97 family phage prohead protease